jgi:hypothetical protein
MGLHDEATLNVKFVDFARQMNLYLNHFPQYERHALCQRIRDNAYKMYEFIIEAQKSYQKKTSLNNVDKKHEQVRMLINVGFELGYFEFTDGSKSDEEKDRTKVAAHRYLVISRMVDEMGRMINGWRKKEIEKAKARAALEAEKAKALAESDGQKSIPVAGIKREAS